MNYLNPLLLASILIFISCSDPKSTNNVELSCDSISQLMSRDQDLRQTKLKGQFFSYVDSIMISNGFSGGLDDLGDLSGDLKDSIWQEANDLIMPFSAKQQILRDSLWKIQRKIDSLNTLQVILQINTYGMDSLNRIDQKCDQNSLIVFVHAPEGLKDQVQEVIDANQLKVGENRMRHINWHLNGREN